MRFAPHDVIREDRGDGSVILRSAVRPGPVARRATDWLDHWAAATPDAVFLAERSGAGWREVAYGEVRDRVRALAAGLLDLALDGPLMVISGNGVDHGLLALAAQYVGIPVVPAAEQYALVPAARPRLDDLARRARPGAVFAEDGDAYADALGRDVFAGAVKLVARGAGRTLDDLARAGGDIGAAHDAVGPETVAKILFTSGSTSAPKGVLTTQAMMCANQAQIAAAMPFLTQRPPCIVDWLPWNHVFGGSHNVNLMLANGGALYVDGGRPVAPLVGRTIENVRLQRATIAFNVPAGFALLRDAMRGDTALRDAYFRDLDMLFYAGASLPQDVWADLEAMAAEAGAAPLITSSWGLTETAPAALLQTEAAKGAGQVGVPLPGTEIKLVPTDEAGRWDVRVRGPQVFGGYLEDPRATAAAFDEEGFFVSNDAMRLVDESDPNRGLRFDGRLSEDFKLTTGTWVRAGNLRLEMLRRLAPLAADVILTGSAEVVALIVPTPAAREMGAEEDGVLVGAALGAALRDRLADHTGGTSERVARALVLAEPPSMAEGEVTAKGNLNFRRLLERRATLVARLGAGGPGVTEAP